MGRTKKPVKPYPGELRQANEILRKAARILRRQSSTAGRSDERVHRRTSRDVRGRADLPEAADRPVHLARLRRPSGLSLE